MERHGGAGIVRGFNRDWLARLFLVVKVALSSKDITHYDTNLGSLHTTIRLGPLIAFAFPLPPLPPFPARIMTEAHLATCVQTRPNGGLRHVSCVKPVSHEQVVWVSLPCHWRSKRVAHQKYGTGLAAKAVYWKHGPCPLEPVTIASR